MYGSYKEHHTFVFAVLINYSNNIECFADLTQLNSKNARFGSNCFPSFDFRIKK